MSETVIIWFRQDLRLTDLPALQAAAKDAKRVLPLYILDDDAAGDWKPGAASRWWLHHSLKALATSIADLGGRLILRRGDTATVLRELCEASGVQQVFFSRRYEPWAAAQERQLHDELKQHEIEIKRYPGTLLHEPGSVLTQSGEPFKVFTPFWRACQRVETAPPVPVPDVQWSKNSKEQPGDDLGDWALLPTQPNWARDWPDYWTPGEAGARKKLQAFLDGEIADYAERRDLPGVDATSRLSPHLHHGEISPRQVFAMCEQQKSASPESSKAINKFQAELGWREFSNHLLQAFPRIPEQPFKTNFSNFPWQPNDAWLARWQRGMTGYPIVDAGMRELWGTGFMHNRVRMVVASFLCKHLLQHWRSGENWFWDTLVDADMASNGCSWQWVAGSGADAAPYFRIFNPVTQGEKFDKKGVYVRHWVPELADMPDKYLHKPWEAPGEVLKAAGVDLGSDYPEPMVDHREARQAALDAYEQIKLSASAPT